ncbi:MAG: hypothetical protein WD077_15110 [Bacteroidia bacterium]
MRAATFLTICSLFFILPFYSCETDLNVNADWKEISVVYGLLNADDSVHYIKVSKAFLNENTSAIEVAGIQDSLYHQDSLSVFLQEINDRGQISREIHLRRTYNENKESGIFSYPGQYLYRTPPGVVISTDHSYTLFVRNLTSGYETSATTPVVNPVTPIYPGNAQTQIQFWRYSDIRFSWIAGLDAKFYHVECDFFYEEFPKTDPSDVVQKTMVWRLGQYLLSNPAIKEEMTLQINGEIFYRTIVSNIPVNADLQRRVTGIQFRFASGATEAYYYITLNEPSAGVVQRKPEYTNMSNGFGVFSSRHFATAPASLGNESIDSLILGSHTRDLNFIR